MSNFGLVIHISQRVVIVRLYKGQLALHVVCWQRCSQDKRSMISVRDDDLSNFKFSRGAGSTLFEPRHGFCPSAPNRVALAASLGGACTQLGSPSGCRARPITVCVQSVHSRKPLAVLHERRRVGHAGGPFRHSHHPAGHAQQLGYSGHAFDHMHTGNQNPNRAAPRHRHTGM